jgi:hypothetical protein
MLAAQALLILMFFQTHSRADMGMGFDQAKTIHHFILTKDGGYIDIAVRNASDSANREAIRKHLQHVAGMFKAGDFSVPMFIHDENPDGIQVMKRLAAAIDYRYTQTKTGARLTIVTNNREALQGIHAFLRYQIREHHTGDSLRLPG